MKYFLKMLITKLHKNIGYMIYISDCVRYTIATSDYYFFANVHDSVITKYSAPFCDVKT